jgi:hypothetical protein
VTVIRTARIGAATDDLIFRLTHLRGDGDAGFALHRHGAARQGQYKRGGVERLLPVLFQTPFRSSLKLTSNAPASVAKVPRQGPTKTRFNPTDKTLIEHGRGGKLLLAAGTNLEDLVPLGNDHDSSVFPGLHAGIVRSSDARWRHGGVCGHNERPVGRRRCANLVWQVESPFDAKRILI